MMNARGQAIAEFLVSLLALVPLWLGAVYLTGLHEAASAVQLGARYAAFDFAAGSASEEETLARVRRFVIDRESGPVRRQQSGADARAWADMPALWRDPQTRSPWAQDRGAVSLRLTDRDLPGAAGAASAAAQAVARSAGPLGEPQPLLSARGFRRAEVSLRLATAAVPALPDPYVLTAKLELLGDTWSAERSADTARRVRAIAPLRVLSPVFAILEPLTPLLQLFEPTLRQFCPGQVAAEIVPPDRLDPIPGSRTLAEPLRCARGGL